jgi:Cutinase
VKRLVLLLMLLAVALLGVCQTAFASSRSSAQSSETCPAWFVVSTRGSGDPFTKDHGYGAPGAAFVEAVKKEAKPVFVGVVANPYPAAGLTENWQAWLNLVGAGSKIPHLGAYKDSVANGEDWLKQEILKEIARCPTPTRLLLTGYSQGAQVTEDVVSKLGRSERNHIAGVVLFGDPRYRHTDMFAGQFDLGRTHDGIVGKRDSVPQDIETRTLSYCHKLDPVCQSPVHLGAVHSSFHQHLNYAKLGEPEEAARWLVGSYNQGFKTPPLGFSTTLKAEGSEPAGASCDLFKSKLDCLFVGHPTTLVQCNDGGGPAPLAIVSKNAPTQSTSECIDEHFIDWLPLTEDRPSWRSGGYSCDLAWTGTGLGRMQVLTCKSPAHGFAQSGDGSVTYS